MVDDEALRLTARDRQDARREFEKVSSLVAAKPEEYGNSYVIGTAKAVAFHRRGALNGAQAPSFPPLKRGKFGPPSGLARLAPDRHPVSQTHGRPASCSRGTLCPVP